MSSLWYFEKQIYKLWSPWYFEKQIVQQKQILYIIVAVLGVLKGFSFDDLV